MEEKTIVQKKRKEKKEKIIKVLSNDIYIKIKNWFIFDPFWIQIIEIGFWRIASVNLN